MLFLWFTIFPKAPYLLLLNLGLTGAQDQVQHLSDLAARIASFSPLIRPAIALAANRSIAVSSILNGRTGISSEPALSRLGTASRKASPWVVG